MSFPSKSSTVQSKSVVSASVLQSTSTINATSVLQSTSTINATSDLAALDGFFTQDPFGIWGATSEPPAPAISTTTTKTIQSRITTSLNIQNTIINTLASDKSNSNEKDLPSTSFYIYPTHSSQIPSNTASPSILVPVPPDSNNDNNNNNNNIPSFINLSSSNIISVLSVTAVITVLLLAYVFHIVQRKRKRTRIVVVASSTDSNNPISSPDHAEMIKVLEGKNQRHDDHDIELCDSPSRKKASEFILFSL